MKNLIDNINKFAQERDWEQFHTPKNLVMALSVEVSEIMEHFQWLTPEQSYDLPIDKLAEIKEEIGDTFTYLLRLCEILNIDILQAAREKLELNKLKYPVGLQEHLCYFLLLYKLPFVQVLHL